MYPNGTRRPIAYASRTLNEHEKRYGQIDKEALAVMFGLKRFHLYLYGRHFTILTDHKPLKRIFGPRQPSLPWQQCVSSVGLSFCQPLTTASDLFLRRKMQLLTHCQLSKTVYYGVYELSSLAAIRKICWTNYTRVTQALSG